jgi:hypothetical protein
VLPEQVRASVLDQVGQLRRGLVIGDAKVKVPT